MINRCACWGYWSELEGSALLQLSSRMFGKWCPPRQFGLQLCKIRWWRASCAEARTWHESEACEQPHLIKCKWQDTPEAKPMLTMQPHHMFLKNWFPSGVRLASVLWPGLVNGRYTTLVSHIRRIHISLEFEEPMDLLQWVYIKQPCSCTHVADAHAHRCTPHIHTHALTYLPTYLPTYLLFHMDMWVCVGLGD